MIPNRIVYVLDSSVLIDTKGVIAARHQWEFFERLKVMVQDGQVCFPKAVRDELDGARHIDTPEAWTLNAFAYIPRSREPDMETVAEVMSVAGDVVEADAEGDPADPYVLAQALELQRSAGVDAMVVTKDQQDKPGVKIAMSTACGRLRLSYCGLPEFLQDIGFDPKTGWGA